MDEKDEKKECNPDDWMLEKKFVLEALKQNKQLLTEVSKTVTEIKSDLSGFKGKVFGVAMGISALISFIVTTVGIIIMILTNK